MITGDHPLTACSVAAKLRMLGGDRSAKAEDVMILRYHHQASGSGHKLAWVAAGNEDGDVAHLEQNGNLVPYDPDAVFDLRQGGDVHLCVTGSAVAEILRRVEADIGDGSNSDGHQSSANDKNNRICDALRCVTILSFEPYQ